MNIMIIFILNEFNLRGLSFYQRHPCLNRITVFEIKVRLESTDRHYRARFFVQQHWDGLSLFA